MYSTVIYFSTAYLLTAYLSMQNVHSKMMHANIITIIANSALRKQKWTFQTCLLFKMANDLIEQTARSSGLRYHTQNAVSCSRLKVTCDDAHLHYIHPYQFIDSPEWEAFHESSADIFQVMYSTSSALNTLDNMKMKPKISHVTLEQFTWSLLTIQI